MSGRPKPAAPEERRRVDLVADVDVRAVVNEVTDELSIGFDRAPNRSASLPILQIRISLRSNELLKRNLVAALRRPVQRRARTSAILLVHVCAASKKRIHLRKVIRTDSRDEVGCARA